MVVIKRAKISRYRGSKTHGCGSMKKRRGAGNRGGRGNAGSGKRGDANKPSNWKDKNHFGKYGFTKVNKAKIRPINIKQIEDNIATFLSKDYAKKEADIYVINLTDLGYNKLLSTGKSTLKLKLTIETASAKAVAKIKSAGGEVILPAKKPKAKEKSPKPEGKE